ncbi:MAG: hypothetical protein V4722_07180 [Bacteroidota bacterium]
MLSIEPFNRDDLTAIKTMWKSLMLYPIIFLFFLLPASFLFGLFGSLDSEVGYWPTTWGLIIVFALLTTWVWVAAYLTYKNDMKEQLKYCGMIAVNSKSKKKGQYYIYTDTRELEKIDLRTKGILDKVETGDNLHIEVSKYSKKIFSLKKNGINII